MKDIFKGTRMPKSGRQLDQPAYIFSCPSCEYEFSYLTKEAARAAKLTHCRTAGGEAHHKMIVEHLWDESPLALVEAVSADSA